MRARHRKDLVVDTNVMRLYDKPKDPEIKALFCWIKFKGVLTVNRRLVSEYVGAGNQLVVVLLNELHRDRRLNPISLRILREYRDDRHYKYTCNLRDIMHARTVFLSYRKQCISFDKKLRNDINGYKKVGGRKPCACSHPNNCCLN